ncbi:BCCT family transporter [Sporosarcina sp. P33]|uniref:BCCT family transporter n=1 Tax=Sporosarcina sp. P33 TaxID=1930764 RepID=UPI0018C8C40C|nr:BCCT family transporter [Sporosarcina sp. P33]
MRKTKIDWFIFISTFVLIVAICLPLILYPEKGSELVNLANGFVTQKFGMVFLWAGAGGFAFLIYLYFSKHGKIKFGTKDEKPEFSNFSWGAMIFCAGVASGLVYWATIEWAYYFKAPPYGIEAGSVDGAEIAAAYGIFHWGPSAWAFFVLPAIPIAYSYYILKVPILRLSEICRIVIGKRADGLLGKAIDIAFMFGILGAAGTSLGLGTPLVAAGVSKVTGIEASMGMNVFILILCTALFTWSAYSGLKRGLKLLSDIAIVFSILLLSYVLIVGPTEFLLKMGTNSIGMVFDNFIRWNTYTDPVSNSGFVEGWTVFYWAWWIVYTPFMGLFIAKISKGRTIQQVILGGISWGSLGCTAYFTILGNYAMNLELTKVLSITSLVEQIGAPAAIIEVINTLPFGWFAVLVFSFIALIFLATTFDSAAYMMASATTPELKMNEEPAKWNRLFWAITLFILPATLMVLGGDLQTIQTASILTALPFILVIALLVISLLRMLKTEAHLEQDVELEEAEIADQNMVKENLEPAGINLQKGNLGIIADQHLNSGIVKFENREEEKYERL